MMDKDYVKSVIAKLQGDKEKACLVPNYVLMEDIKHEVVADLSEILRELCRSGEIAWSKTLNSVGFSIPVKE